VGFEGKNMNYTIYPLYNGAFTVGFGSQEVFSNIENIPSFCFLVIGDDHTPVLVDTGFDRNWIPGINSTALRKPENELPAALAKYGLHTSDIKLVIQTHLHWDHTGGMGLFPHARFIVQAQELLYLQQLPPAQECSHCPAHWLPLMDCFDLVNGTTTIMPGLRVHLTGKHTGGHQVVEVTTASGPYILGGDAPFNYDYVWDIIPREYWDKFRQGPGHDQFWHAGVRSQLEAFISKHSLTDTDTPLQNIKQLPGQLILSHDNRLLNIPRLPG
jgi:N-acyl homoserine lactone hydrolase